MLRYQGAVASNRMAMTSGQWMRCLGTLALLLVVVSSGAFGLAHQHADHEPADEHQCAICHVQQITCDPSRSEVLVSAEAPSDRAVVAETGPAESLAVRHMPPLRGPPIGA